MNELVMRKYRKHLILQHGRDMKRAESDTKILIKGVEIEQEIGEACLDYSNGNWVGFGYNIAKLIKALIGDAALTTVEVPAIAN